MAPNMPPAKSPAPAADPVRPIHESDIVKSHVKWPLLPFIAPFHNRMYRHHRPSHPNPLHIHSTNPLPPTSHIPLHPSPWIRRSPPTSSPDQKIQAIPIKSKLSVAVTLPAFSSAQWLSLSSLVTLSHGFFSDSVDLEPNPCQHGDIHDHCTHIRVYYWGTHP